VFADAYASDVDIPAAIELAHEQAHARFTDHGWRGALVELAAERAWLAAHRATFG